MQHPFCQPREHLLSRRQLLGRSGTALAAGLGVGALGGLVQPLVAEELQKKQRQVLFIWIDGGMSQLESWDPKPGTQFGGPFRSIPTSLPGIHVSELMPKTSNDSPFPNTSPGHCDRPGFRPMISSNMPVDTWSSSELRHGNHEYMIQHATLLKVFDNGRKGLVKTWHQARMSVEIIAVGIPTI